MAFPSGNGAFFFRGFVAPEVRETVGFDFGIVLVFLVVGIGFVLANLLVGKLLRPRFPDANKEMIYDCGERPIGQAWFNFNPRFYIVAIVFVVFEVEIVLMLPVAMVYKAWIQQGLGGIAFAEIGLFILILAVGLAWIWARGDLEWVRTLREDERARTAARAASPAAAAER